MSLFEPTMQARARVSVLRELLETRGLSVCVVGAGKSGGAAARLLHERGCRVRMLDDRAGAAWGAEEPGGPAGPIDKASVDAADLVVLSPGVPRRRPELRDAIELGKLVGEVEVASWFVSAPLVGVTGTNGKSTVTALVGHGFRSAGRSAFVGGNLGTPLSELVRSGENVDVAVVELSSFQLESLVEARFAAAVWLNLTPDHGDRYDSVADYALAKRRIIEQRRIDGVGILNAKDRYCTRFGLELGGPLRWFSGEGPSDLAGPMGTVVRADGVAVRNEMDRIEHYDLAGVDGVHQRANRASAIEVWRHFELAPASIRHALAEFRGLPHRLETIPSDDGCTWVNDSKATNVAAAVAALDADRAPTVWIAGGRDKGSALEPLVEAARRNRIKAVLLIGEASDRFETALSSLVGVERTGTLERAVARARELAEPGDRILLAPACASYDQFLHFEARGERFRALVEGRA
ncbi:MAG TPA: UDP-N-acetylmuramoyl-L-alanine--D-glutamate ligase [Myxococcales bacterium LLY-WYZ-16_1]|nr:UDP-N-acetylmuramoyl-L-alanine--D-glutamate ligase [Myxococcales bacterium LLY-WYZ-16_1]